MNVHIEPPSSMDVLDIKLNSELKTIDMTPLTLKGQSVIRLAYITVTGKKGSVAKGVVLFNGTTGDFSVRTVTGQAATMMFDEMDPQAYESKIVERRDKNTKAAQKRRRGEAEGDTEDTSQPSIVAPPSQPPGVAQPNA